MMSPDLQRLLHIQDYCKAISDTIRRYGSSYEDFLQDADYQRSISFSIFQIGELSNGLSEEFKAKTLNRIPWKAIRGMRNMFAHQYGKVDLSSVWQTATSDIPALLEFCTEQLSQANN